MEIRVSDLLQLERIQLMIRYKRYKNKRLNKFYLIYLILKILQFMEKFILFDIP